MGAKVAVRAVLNPTNKVYGMTSDRFFFGSETAALDFSVLSLLDSKRDFRFLEKRLSPAASRAAFSQSFFASNYSNGGNRACNRTMMGYEMPIQELYHYPYFFSASQACPRSLLMQSSSEFSDLFGSWKGPHPVFVVDNQGNAGDFLAPGTKLYASRTGMVHKYVDQGAFDGLVYAANNTTARDAWNGGIFLSNMPVIVGYSPWSAASINPYFELTQPTIDINSTTSGTPGYWAFVKFGGFIHQDATYIYFLQVCASFGSGGSQYDAVGSGPPSKVELIALKKSDGTTTNITLSSYFVQNFMTGIITKSVTTTEGTPQKAAIFCYTIGNSTTKTIYTNKIIGTTATNVGAPSFVNYFYGDSIPTQLMENKNASFNTHWKCYWPMAGYNSNANNENALTLQLMRFNKTLLAVPTLTACTLSGIPLEYCSANGDGTKLRCMNTTKTVSNGRYDIAFAAEIYDGGDHYIAYWIGRNKSPVWTSDIDTYSYGEMSDQAYRWFLVFKVGADDNILSYVSCVPEFKLAKPMYCYAASADNKYMAMANADGLFCFAWSTSAKAFICTDQLALPGIFSIGMDEVQSGGKGTVFVEILTSPNNPETTQSHIYQVDFGDYEDVDIRYFNGSSYVTDFGFNMLNLTVDGSNNFTQQTITAEVRVKNKVGTTETTFVDAKTVRLKISGIRETDGCSFVGADSGNPYQKTITTTSAGWTQFQFYIQKPLDGMKITGEIV